MASITAAPTASPNPPVLANTKLFAPLKIGNLTLQHRVVLAPLTRVRSPEHIPDDRVVEYYTQRASAGGLLISEATHISVIGGNYHRVPGIFTPEQIRAWKKVTDAVHAKGGYIFCQLWHVGRTTHPENLGGRAPLGPSANAVEGGYVFFTPTGPQPCVPAEAMTLSQIEETISDYVHAAKSAVAAGFDGVEIHAANGYLLDQFLCDNINTRTDAYGGSDENRARLTLEVVDAVAAAIGKERTGIRFSPFGMFQGTATSDLVRQYGVAVKGVAERGVAYIHLVEPRSGLNISDEEKLDRLRGLEKDQGRKEGELQSLAAFRKLMGETPLITNGGFHAGNSVAPLVNGEVDAIAYGRYFISNPDLPERLKRGVPLAKYNRDTFYTSGAEGYVDYPAATESKL